jgi:hypothetical protein
MGTEASFQQILEEKIHARSRSERPGPPPPLEQDPAHLAYLLGTLGVSYWRPQTTKIYPMAPRPAPRPHVLTADQQQAFEFFTLHGTPLSPAFTPRELKKAFRGLALKLHPDMNKGTSVGPFMELKQNYETLLTALV